MGFVLESLVSKTDVAQRKASVSLIKKQTNKKRGNSGTGSSTKDAAKTGVLSYTPQAYHEDATSKPVGTRVIRTVGF